MNKWINLFGTVLMTLAFAVTVRTTIANPSGSNVAISAVLAVLVLVGLYLFSKGDKKNPNKKQNSYDGFTAVKE